MPRLDYHPPKVARIFLMHRKAWTRGQGERAALFPSSHRHPCRKKRARPQAMFWIYCRRRAPYGVRAESINPPRSKLHNFIQGRDRLFKPAGGAE